MRLKRMTKQEKSQVKILYQQAFPKEERRPFSLLLWECKKRVMEILCVEEKGEFVGILISSFSKDLVLIEYFAINPNQRGGGIGSKVLQLVKKRYQGRRIMLEIETPDGEEIKARREEFYKRNGFQDIGVPILFCGVNMKVLSLDGISISYEEYKKHYKKTAGLLVTKLIGISKL